MAEWTREDIDEWFGGDMDEARERMAYERKQSRPRTHLLTIPVRVDDLGVVFIGDAVGDVGIGPSIIREAGGRLTELDDEEPDREPSAEQEKAWNEQYDGTSMGA